MERFEELLEGAHQVDEHFRTTPFERNIPLLMGLLGIWYNNFFGAQTYAILPYDQYLEYLPTYLQQGDMESNGKTMDINGQPVAYPTGPVIFGQPGTNGQHAFYQLIHQGSELIPCDFIAAAQGHHSLGRHHEILIANFLAQPEALMRGKTYDEALAELRASGVDEDDLAKPAAAKTFPGNKPTNTILYRKLTPRVLGSLIALYEHKIFTQGAIWNINSFDQMGVELGKQLAQTILAELSSDEPAASHDSSTNGLIDAYKRMRQT
jgi:glucose-6-phosphate isomerase